MFSSLFKKSNSQTAPQQLYGSVMTHARSPEFFTDFAVPDTVMGRFDMLSLHVYLLARRLREDGSPLAMDLSQEVFDLYVADVERALRELGIGDTSVPKKKKKMIRSFYGQIEDFDEAINQEDANTLNERVAARYLADEENPEVPAKKLADYILRTEKMLKSQDFKKILSGSITWKSFEGL
jgi:cytochrome b pre-mRNA-processing protein 3